MEENTSVKFYITCLRSREFCKLSFEIIFLGYGLSQDSIDDTILDHKIPMLMDKYDIEMIFDMKIISCTKTAKPINSHKLLDIKYGKLLFEVPKKINTPLSEFASIDDLNHQIKLLAIKLETANAKLETADEKLKIAEQRITTLTETNKSLNDRFKLSAKSYWV